jgi:LysM repeat protein
MIPSMNNPNPLIPQGSLLEQQARTKPHLRIALFIVAVHVVFLGLLLMQGCKRENDPLEMAESATNDSPFGIPDQSTLFDSNVSSGLELGTPRDPASSMADPEGGLDQRTLDPLGEGPATNPVAAPVVPTPVPAPTPVVTREHVVVPGDTFYMIAKHYGVTVAAISNANPNVDPNRLRPQQRLIIPPPGPAVSSRPAEELPTGVEIYEVKRGDTLTGIARTHSTTMSAIRQLNGITTDRIYAGQKLKLPPKTNAVSAPQNP